MGLALLEDRQLARARKEFEAVVQRFPAKAAPRLGLGMTIEETGDLAGAEAAYRTAVKLEPGSAQALYRLGLVLKHQKRYTTAIGYLRLFYREINPPSRLTPRAGVALESVRLLQQFKECLLQAARLRQSGNAGLLQDLLLGKLGCHLRNIGVLHYRASGRQIRICGLQIGCGGLKTLLHGAELSTDILQLLQRVVDDIESCVRAGNGADIGVCQSFERRVRVEADI